MCASTRATTTLRIRMTNDDLVLAQLCLRAKYLSLKRIGGQQQQKKHDARKRKNKSPLVARFSLILNDHFFDFFFFFCVKTSFCCFALFCGSFVKNNLVRKLVSLVFSRSVQRDTRREEEEEEEGRRGRRFFFVVVIPVAFFSSHERKFVYIERGNFFARVSQTYISSAIESKLLRANTCNTCETRT